MLNNINPTDREALNHQAYMDVLDCKEPSIPENEIYMECYDSWRPLQQFPEDRFDEGDIL